MLVAGLELLPLDDVNNFCKRFDSLLLWKKVYVMIRQFKKQALFNIFPSS